MRQRSYDSTTHCDFLDFYEREFATLENEGGAQLFCEYNVCWADALAGGR